MNKKVLTLSAVMASMLLVQQRTLQIPVLV
jgi:hypothetical protein